MKEQRGTSSKTDRMAPLSRITIRASPSALRAASSMTPVFIQITPTVRARRSVRSVQAPILSSSYGPLAVVGTVAEVEEVGGSGSGHPDAGGGAGVAGAAAPIPPSVSRINSAISSVVKLRSSMRAALAAGGTRVVTVANS